MENNLLNEEIMENAVEEIANASFGRGIRYAGGAAVIGLAGYGVYKLAKPGITKLRSKLDKSKTNKEAIDVKFKAVGPDYEPENDEE